MLSITVTGCNVQMVDGKDQDGGPVKVLNFIDPEHGQVVTCPISNDLAKKIGAWMLGQESDLVVPQVVPKGLL